ncbi:protein-export chaperone SecB [Candidatus Erwinia haradaeae]|uniref:Protein-export protein SecB n=1 Tax=Candidatus Erwinia haradaeae TaxID=1922217 RepID=A0A803GC61_9GAMM|nr:protein-export chaperone SecB [Candidatus Erwinia haradaeae]VFP87206.1 Protein-export protein SecB [Candidatus Erwinia haradaeae]
MIERQAPDISFQIQRIYTKDISFETPHSPQIFQQTWEPEVKIHVETNSIQLSDNTYEVLLRITVNATIVGNTAFLCEVQQAGIFFITHVEDKQMAYTLSVCCPNIIYPYASECIASLILRGTLSPLNLGPINFEKLFMESLNKPNTTVVT